MSTTFNATIEFKSITPEQWEELSAFLKRGDTPDPLISYERQRGNDLENEADKPRNTLAGILSVLKDIQGGEPNVALPEYIKATQAAIAAYDNSTHKAIPF